MCAHLFWSGKVAESTDEVGACVCYSRCYSLCHSSLFTITLSSSILHVLCCVDFFLDFFHAVKTIYLDKYSEAIATELAERSVAEIEGSLMFSRVFNEPNYLRNTTKRVLNRLEKNGEANGKANTKAGGKQAVQKARK